MDRLRRYDIYAPVAEAETSIEFDTAARLVLDSFREFSPAVAQAAARVLEQNHLDADERPGKRGGGHAATPGRT